MKKDIIIPPTEGVHFVAAKEQNNDKSEDWFAYIVNENTYALSTVIILSEGYGNHKKTSSLRKTINHLPPKSYAKVEMITAELIPINNVFKVSYFVENQLFDNTYVFKANRIKDKHLSPIPILEKKGILAE